MQLYLPPDYMMNKDFLKEVLVKDKMLMKMQNVAWINVPLYDELSVIKIWPQVRHDAQLMQYFPTKLPKGRVPDREYFYNMVNTHHPEFVQQLIMHANEQRNAVNNEARANEAIEIHDDWWDQLNAVPFVSCKYRAADLLAPRGGN